jgi:hypothetical protein
MKTQLEKLSEVIGQRGGVLLEGSHGDCSEGLCILEAVNLAKSGKATDSPIEAGMPDLRPLNDAPWSSDAERTKHCLPVALALWDWANWSAERKQAFAERLALATVRETLADMLDSRGLDSTACRAATTLGEAESADDAAYYAAYYAADAAYYAYYADHYAAADAVLATACAIWVLCAEETAGL